jgi:uncharacterized protein (TIGR02145 family)
MYCFLLTLMLLASFGQTHAQTEGVAINKDGSPPDPSAILHLKSTTQGFMLPNMTELQRDSILNPPLGLLIFQTDGNSGIHYYDGTTWQSVRLPIENNASRCPETFKDPRDGEVYPIVTIGDQCWMAENLRYNASGSWLNPANLSSEYGRLYNWSTAMASSKSSSSNPSGVQGVCPCGWHLPSDAEWNEMELSLGMANVDTSATGYRGTHSTNMKSVTGWESSSNEHNSSGFNGFPTGFYYSGKYSTLGLSSRFWSSTEYSLGHAWYRNLSYINEGVYRYCNEKKFGFSCRCVKDQ